MKLKDVLEKTAGFFREKGLPSARLDAELLLAHGLGVDRIRLYLDFDRPLAEPELGRLRELVRRRGQGEPVAYLTGKKDFFGFTFEIGPGVLIPRPETEHLVETALEEAKKWQDREIRVVDLGCGSGCIGLAILKNLPTARLLAMDLNPLAIKTTTANAEALGVLDRLTVLEGDATAADIKTAALSAAGFESIDLLLANPPYIAPEDVRLEKNVKDFEPSSALFAGKSGLAALQSWSHLWASNLAPKGLIAMEMGNDQGEAMSEFFRSLNLSEVEVIKDLAGHPRVIKGVRHG